MSDESERRRRFNYESLTARLMLVMGGLIAGTALILSALAIYLLGAELDRGVQARLSTAKGLADAIIDQRVAETARVARATALDGQMLEALRRRDRAAVDAVLERYAAVLPDSAVWTADASGELLSSRSGVQLRDQQLLLTSVAQGNVSAGLATSADCQLLALSAIPVRSGDQLLGGVIVATPLDHEIVDQVRANTQLGVWTYCGNGQSGVLTGATALELDPSVREAALGRAQVSLGNSRADGVEGYGYYVPLIDVRRAVIGMVAVVQPVQEIVAARDNATRLFGGAAALLALLVLSEAYVLARLITRPLQALTRATQAIAAGDLASPIATAGRDEIGILARSFEVMRARLAQMVADLERERNRYRDFLTMMPHEFKTPLSAMSASLELLEADEETLSADQASLLASARRSVIRLQQLVDNLLDTASIQAGHFEVHAEPNDLMPIVEEARLLVQPLLDQKGQRLCIEASARLPRVMADPRRVTQVVVNLLSNAHKYGPAAQAISLSVSAGDTAVRVAVADRGPGIAPDQQQGLFQRFMRMGVRGSQHPSGIGFGLAIVHEIVKLHGGRVGVESQAGHGTLIWFELPVAHAEDDEL